MTPSLAHAFALFLRAGGGDGSAVACASWTSSRLG